MKKLITLQYLLQKSKKPHDNSEHHDCLNCKLLDIDLMEDILKYNEIDCKTMMEIILYLRSLVVDGPDSLLGEK